MLRDGETARLPDGVSFSRHGDVYVVSRENGETVSATLNSTWIDVDVGLGRASHPPARGLLGGDQGRPDQLVTQNGRRLSEPVSFPDLYHVFGDGWRLADGPTWPSVRTSCRRAQSPTAPFYAQDLAPALFDRARAACVAKGVVGEALIDFCALDAGLIGTEKAADVFVRSPRPPRWSFGRRFSSGVTTYGALAPLALNSPRPAEMTASI